MFTGSRIGTIQPVLRHEVIPGDTWYGSNSILARFKGFAKPVVTPVYLDVFYFYVPNRIVWDGWENFITGEDRTLHPPLIAAAPGVASYFLYGSFGSKTPNVNGLYVRACNMVWNEFFRDQDIQAERDLSATTVMNANYFKNVATVLRPKVEQVDVTFQGEVSGPKATIEAADVRDSLRNLRLAERRAMFGERYFDVLRSWGIRTNYQWLDRPEYLGRSRNIVSFSDIPATSSATGVTFGDLAGHGIVGVHHRFRRKVFPEHGYIIGLAVCRPIPVAKGFSPADATKSQIEDYWAPEFEMQSPVHVNQVLVQEIDTGNGIGYLPKFEEYRRVPNLVVGESLIDDYVAFYNPGVSATPATAQQNLIECQGTSYDELFNDTSATSQHFMLLVHNKLSALRMVSRVRTQ